ncbi:hypothetical protein GCM10011376_21670 [Nocardioides flavus (ex Wang et al. 2016)]|uniref:Uncharacterized protein n=1 Tax=Nocardioides flavus (ex Wang et al. 2016) TaxID=2058780 RepID=A0ABQ3HLN4_9ACTN|nr:hypothetical protein [Nocardioides flavus (ex Wang et al. 2016)]GHE17557.1 hypothetical protein GCM10011376_21670 [Nocardioides flavus (ex Wang et al. 2016)]
MHVPPGMRRVVAAVCAVALASSPALLAPTTAGASGAATASASAEIPHLTAKVTKRGIRVTGTDGLRAGRVHLTVTGRATVEFVTFKEGYGPDRFVADVNKCGEKCNVKALRRAIANTTIIGGTSPGEATIVFPRAGAYYPFTIGERGAAVGRAFRVSGPPRRSRAPRVDGSIIAKSGLAWGGASTLPAEGRFRFQNRRSAGVPHFVQLQQVVEGTTADQVLESFQAGPGGPPPPFLEATLLTGTLSPGHSMTVDYDLPPGHYAVMCFFPDPDMKGMPHAFMGMIRIIRLT